MKSEAEIRAMLEETKVNEEPDEVDQKWIQILEWVLGEEGL